MRTHRLSNARCADETKGCNTCFMEDVTPKDDVAPGQEKSPTGLVNHARDWLVDKEYRPIWHLAAAIVIIGFACLLFYQHFRTSGTLLHVDMNFPFTLDRIAGQVTNTWLQHGGFQTISFIEMGPWTLAYVVLAKVFQLSRAQYLLVMVISTFSLAGISMYALAYSTIRSIKSLNRAKVGLFVGSVLAAIIYMYNPYSMFQLWPFMMYVAYALIPLIFMLLKKLYRSPSAGYLILFVLLISIGSTHPSSISWIWTLIVAYSVYYLLVNRFARRSLATAAKVLFPTVGLYLLVNAAWTVPYVTARFSGIPLGPNYAPFFGQSALDGLSITGTLSNNLRLTSGFGQFVIPGANSAINILLSFALPVFTLLCLVLLGKRLKRNPTFLFWGLLSVILILFATGSSFILRRLYSYFVFRAPAAASYGWIFRSPNRMLFGVPVFYGLAIGILVAWLLRGVPRSGTRSPGEEEGTASPDDGVFKEPVGASSELLEENLELKRRLGRYDKLFATYMYYLFISMALVIFAVVLLSFYPRAQFYSRYIFDPTKVPGDYAEVDKHITKEAGDARIMWMPFISLDHMVYDWAPAKRIPPANVYTGNPCLDDLQELYNGDSYFVWLMGLLQQNQYTTVQLTNKDVTLANNMSSKLFIPFSARYMIFDSSKQGFNFDAYFQRDPSLAKNFQTNILTVYKTLYNTPLIRAVSRTIKANSFFDNLAISQVLPEEWLGQIAFVDKKPITPSFASVDKKHGLVDINDYREYAVINSGFEVGDDAIGSIWSWKPAPENPPNVQITRDTKERASGKFSLKMVNNNTDASGIGWERGAQLLARPGDIFTLDTSMKYNNVCWSTAALEGYQDATGQWIQLALCPSPCAGSSGWRHYECSVYIPKGISAIRPALAAGWTLDRKAGPSITWFDEVKVSRIESRLYSDLLSPEGQPTVTFKKKSAEKYTVHVKNAKAPFVLVFGEAFDPFWVARMADGTRIAPAPLYSTINGFQIDKKGNFDLTIEYPPQKWYYAGLVISLPVVLLCILFLVYDWIVRRKTGVPVTVAVGLADLKNLGKKMGGFFEAPRKKGVVSRG